MQEFGLARFKSNVTKSTKGFEYVLAKMQGEHLRGEAAPDQDGSLGVTGHVGITPVDAQATACTKPTMKSSSLAFAPRALPALTERSRQAASPDCAEACREAGQGWS